MDIILKILKDPSPLRKKDICDLLKGTCKKTDISEESKLEIRNILQKQVCEIHQKLKRDTTQKLKILNKTCIDSIYTDIVLQTLKDLKKYISDQKIETLNDLLDRFPESEQRTGNKLTKPYIVEALWKLIFIYELDDIPHISKQPREFQTKIEHPKKVDARDYLEEKINSGSKSGIADLFFILKTDKDKQDKKRKACDEDPVKETGKAILFTSKYYKSEKGISNYDASEIIVEAQEKYKKDFSIIFLVKDKNSFKKIIDNTRSKKLKDYIDKEFILDQTDLAYYFKLLCRSSDELPEESVLKTSIIRQLRFHQHYMVNYTCHMIDKHNISKFIWGAVPRSGKSFMVGGLIARKKPQFVFLILGAITETKDQFKNDVFKTYSEFGKYEIIDTQDDKKWSVNPSKNYIFICSQEKLRKDIKDKSDFLQNFEEIIEKGQNLIFFDEVQQGGGFNSMQYDTLNYFYRYKTNLPLLILVTATYAKPLLKYGKNLGGGDIRLITWSYDVNNIKMKTFDAYDPVDIIEDSDIDKIKMLTDTIDMVGKPKTEIALDYLTYPELRVLVPTLCEKREWMTERGDIDIDKLCKIRDEKFVTPSYVNDFLGFIKTNVYDKLFETYKEDQRRWDGAGNFHSQLWFLPTVDLQKYVYVKKCTESIENDECPFEILSRLLAIQITKTKGYEKFNVCIVHGLPIKKDLYDTDGRLKGYDDRIFFASKGKDKSIKENIEEIERKSESDGQSLIILTGKMLRLGISLSCVDLAIHMDPIESVDTIYQSMFRVLTERRNKKYGYFVDMNLYRNISFMYSVTGYTVKSENITREQVKNTLYTFNVNNVRDSVILEKGKEAYTDVYTKLMTAFKLRKETEFIDFLEKQKKTQLRKIEDVLKNFLDDKITSDPSVKKELFKYIKSLGISSDKEDGNKKQKTVVVQSEYMKPHEEKGKEEKKDEKEEKEEKDEITKKHIENMIKKINNIFTLFLLFNEDENPSLQSFYDLYKQEYDISRILECKDDEIMTHCYIALQQVTPSRLDEKHISHTDIRREIDKYIKMIQYIQHLEKDNILENLFENNKRNMSKKLLKLKLKVEKDAVDNSSDNSTVCPEEFLKIHPKVLDTIRAYLIPEQKDRENFGEVFTPLELVCEMLSKLPKKVWSDPSLVWLDPANGIGNFPVIVYYKLMDGLKKVFPNEAKRSKHIIEKMLFMIELNPVNVSICKKIFKMLDSDSKPNVYTGNTLELNQAKLRAKGFPDKYDIIIGNPPFNSGGIKSSTSNTGKTIWPDFIDYAFSLLADKGWLLFITPLSWLRKSHSNHTQLLEKHIVWLQLWDNINALMEINAKIPLSMYVLQNTLNVKKHKTEVISTIKSTNTKTNSLVYLNPSESIPLAYHSIFDKLYSYITKNDLQLEVKAKTVQETGKDFPLPIDYKKEKKDTYSVTTYTVKEGIKVLRSTHKHPDALSTKLIIANKSSFTGAFIDKGYLSLSSGDKFYILGSNLDWLLKLLFFNISNIIVSFTKYRQDFLDREAFSFIPDIRKLGHEISEDELYELIGLTKDEIKQVVTFGSKSVKKSKSAFKSKRKSVSKSKKELKSREKFRKSVKKSKK